MPTLIGIWKWSRMVKISWKSDNCSLSWFPLKFQTLAAPYRHLEARWQLIRNHWKLFASGVSFKKFNWQLASSVHEIWYLKDRSKSTGTPLKFKDESSGTIKCFEKFFVGFFTGSGPENKIKFGTFDTGVLESSKTC